MELWRLVNNAFNNSIEKFGDIFAKDVTRELLANGVTVQEWISVTERLPEEEGWYLVYTTPNREHKSINKAMFCKGYAWGNFEPYWRGAGGHWANVTHWMPLPQPPKGE
jgi:hypothetical protein